MTVLCLGALLAGLVAASLIPFLPFACALLASAAIGAGWALAGGAAVGQTALSAFMLLVACQIGYGGGIVAVARVRQGMGRRRVGGERPNAPTARPLRTGNEPR